MVEHGIRIAEMGVRFSPGPQPKRKTPANAGVFLFFGKNQRLTKGMSAIKRERLAARANFLWCLAQSPVSFLLIIFENESRKRLIFSVSL